MSEAISNDNSNQPSSAKQNYLSEIHKPKEPSKDQQGDGSFNLCLLATALDGYRQIHQEMAVRETNALEANGKEVLREANLQADYVYNTQFVGKYSGSTGAKNLENFNAYNEQVTAERAVPSARIANLQQYAQVLESQASADVNSAVQVISIESAAFQFEKDAPQILMQ